MRAVAFKETGGPEVLREVELPDPVPGPGEVLIAVAWAGVNYGEVQHRLGDFGDPDGETVTGLEASGTVAALGPGVTGVAVGDEVAAYLPDGGGYAELAVAPETFVFPLKGLGLDLRTAGAAPLTLTTAHGVLGGAARIAPGDSVLVHAAAGGVGTVAARLARALGAGAVYGTVGDPAKSAYAARFGHDAILPREGFAEAVRELTGGRGVDVVLDPIGGPTRWESLEALAPFGRVVVYGEAARHPDLSLPVLPVWKNNRALTGYNIGDLARRAPETLRRHALAALTLAGSGAVTVDITTEHPLADAAKAHEVLAAGRNLGKAVLSVNP
ncbi:quinone oxidoreductase family protein (plasmid) [Streptomyces sp. BI20]|uniref:quinone oxidoreductase family protein n=1 Tax=Streptomyces sp. BI20 TaxID=3403460 RepID=UPI003C740AD9